MRRAICDVAVSIGLVACAASPIPQPPAAPPTAPTAPTLVRVVAGDFAFDSSHTVPAGLIAIRLVNQGRAIHMLGIARLDSGKSVADVYHALTKHGPLGWFSEVGGPGAVSPGDSVTQYAVLEPGTYSMICWWPDSTGKAHVMSGMMSTLTVTGTNAGAPVEPMPDIYVREGDYHIEMTGALTAGPHVFRVDNDGPQRHDLTLLRILPGKTDADVEAWLQKPSMRDAPVESLGGTVGVDRWGHTEFAADLKPGDYMFVCMIPDAKDGKPHFMHGMVKRVKIA